MTITERRGTLFYAKLGVPVWAFWPMVGIAGRGTELARDTLHTARFDFDAVLGCVVGVRRLGARVTGTG